MQAKDHTSDEMNAYFDGIRAGVGMWAWWKDGEQRVGSCGTTLKEAMKIIENKRQQAVDSSLIDTSV